MAKPLTKSRFKLALECPTKLYYCEPDNGYRDKNDGDDFLAALADGGHQVGQLAKFKYHPEPVRKAITIAAAEYDQAVEQTRQHLAQPGRVVIAEAALRYYTYFIRVDILIRDEAEKTIEIIEVKSKSVDTDTIESRFQNDRSRWISYLYDITFQANVAKLALPGYKIIPKLLLLDKNESCDVDGLHQHFRVVLDPKKRKVKVVTPVGLTRDALGGLAILREVDVSDVVQELETTPIDLSNVPVEHSGSLRAYMQWVAQLQQSGRRYFGGISKTCRGCQFRADAGDAMRSGVHECWQDAIRQGLLTGGRDPTDRRIPLSIDMWGGGAGSVSIADRVIGVRRAFLADVREGDVRPARMKIANGFTPLERRMAQVRSAADPSVAFELREEVLTEMDRWEWPLHMIDFETSAPALPFFKGMRPYETLAFQFSHHMMEKDARGAVRISHAHQWISTGPGAYPNIDFVRQLRKALMSDGKVRGTVFRYHNHENTVLRALRKIIASSREADRERLISFIDLITKPKKEEEHAGARAGSKAMVDLHRLVQEGYYSSRAGGSISLKYMLPSVLRDAPGVAALYSQSGVYGSRNAIQSLNFTGEEGHVWLQREKGDDPYKTLPGVFGPDQTELNEILFRLAGDDEEDGTINQGGLAMTAYNYTQFADLVPNERQRIADALFRYCELDTLAMVILVQGLMELRGLPLAVITRLS